MAFFEVAESAKLNNTGITQKEVVESFSSHLSPYYQEEGVSILPTGVAVKSHIKDTWAWGVVVAEAEITIQDGQILLSAKGTVKLGKLAWFLFVLGIFTGVFLFVFIYFVILYFRTNDYPERYFKQALKSTASEINKQTPREKVQSNNIATELEKLASLVEKGLLTIEELNIQKQLLIKPELE